MYFGLFNLGPGELVVILIIVLLIFGPKKLPEVGRSFGEMLKNFRQGTREDDSNQSNGASRVKGNDK